MATISATSTRITISGDYKAFTSSSGSTSNVIQFASGDAPASGDAGRFLMWKNGSATADWEIRFIESATASTVTVGDGGFSSAPASGEDFVISTNLADIQSAVSTACTVAGKSYSFNGRDWELTNEAFLADVDISIDTENQSSNASWQVSTNCAVQFGRLTGGEANDSTITRQGCYISMNNTRPNSGSSVFGTGGSELSNGGIVNFYGCYIKNYTSTAARWAFMRGVGPVRFIGSIWDGPIGGAFLHSASELVDTKFRGNTNLTPAWSIRATFVRPVSNVQFANSLAAFKTFQNFTGIFRDTVFDLDSLNTVVFVSGTVGGVTCIDSTTFTDSDITDSGSGFVHQAKSINYTITDANGTGLNGAKVAVYDTDGTMQGSLQTSSSGAVGEIVAISYKWQNSSPSANKAPFDIRIRKYGCVYLGFQSAVSEPIKQEIRLANNPNIVLSKSDATALTGLDIDFNTSTLTVTSDHGTQNLYDYYQRQLEYDAKLDFPESWIRTGDSFDLDNWDMVVDGCTYTGNVTTTGLITQPNGGVFNGTRTDANGTIEPNQPISITNIEAGSRLRIYNVTTGVETVNTVVSGTSYTSSYQEGTGYNDGDTVRVYLTKLGKEEWVGDVIDTSSGFNVLASQVDDDVYTALGVDGTTVTKFQADYPNNEVDLIIGSDWTMAELYAWWSYNLTTEDGIRNFFGGITAIDQANFRINTSIVDLYLDNTTNASYRQTDNRRFFRDTGDGYPVRNPTTSGYGLDVVWRNTILIAQTEAGTSDLNFYDVKRAVKQVITNPKYIKGQK
jgi:hypothetical protein